VPLLGSRPTSHANSSADKSGNSGLPKTASPISPALSTQHFPLRCEVPHFCTGGFENTGCVNQIAYSTGICVPPWLIIELFYRGVAEWPLLRRGRSTVLLLGTVSGIGRLCWCGKRLVFVRETQTSLDASIPRLTRFPRILRTVIVMSGSCITMDSPDLQVKTSISKLLFGSSTKARTRILYSIRVHQQGPRKRVIRYFSRTTGFSASANITSLMRSWAHRAGKGIHTVEREPLRVPVGTASSCSGRGRRDVP